MLVVQLTVPTATSHSSLSSQLLDQTPSYFSYVISFAAVALTWYGHHENFKDIRKYDGRLIALNFGSLVLIAFLPFPTAVLGRNQHEPLAAVTRHNARSEQLALGRNVVVCNSRPTACKT